MASRVLALDYGKARVGVAVSDELGLYAHPRPFLEARNERALFHSIADLCGAEGIGEIVVGLPLDMRGGEGDAARGARTFAARLATHTALPVHLFDERLSTVQAARALAAQDVRGRKAKSRVDSAAACILLEAWMALRQARSVP
jgi:putative Holliday junction resolvase